MLNMVRVRIQPPPLAGFSLVFTTLSQLLRAGCRLLCQIRCCGPSCAKHSIWSTRQRCTATVACQRITWSSWHRRLLLAAATTLRTTATWPYPGPSSTGWAQLISIADYIWIHLRYKEKLCFHERVFCLAAVSIQCSDRHTKSLLIIA